MFGSLVLFILVIASVLFACGFVYNRIYTDGYNAALANKSDYITDGFNKGYALGSGGWVVAEYQPACLDGYYGIDTECVTKYTRSNVTVVEFIEISHKNYSVKDTAWYLKNTTNWTQYYAIV